MKSHREGSTLRTYSRMSVKAARTRSSKRRSLRRRIQTRMIARMTQSTTRCFIMTQTIQPSHDGKLLSFLDRHSRPVVICSRRAATSAESFINACSILRCHRPELLPMSWPISISSSSICLWDRSSASSCSLIGLRTFIGPSLPLIGCVNRREEDVAPPCGDESVELGLLCLIWFHTNSSSETSSLPSLPSQAVSNPRHRSC